MYKIKKNDTERSIWTLKENIILYLRGPSFAFIFIFNEVLWDFIRLWHHFESIMVLNLLINFSYHLRLKVLFKDINLVIFQHLSYIFDCISIWWYTYYLYNINPLIHKPYLYCSWCLLSIIVLLSVAEFHFTLLIVAGICSELFWVLNYLSFHQLFQVLYTT